MNPKSAHPGFPGPSDDLPRAVLDAIPDPVFVVDSNVQIIHCNKAGLETIGTLLGEVIGRLGGEVLHCKYEAEAPGGCGTSPYCGACNIRQSVKQAFQGQTPRRIKHRVHVAVGASSTEVDLLVTTAPIEYDGRQLALLILEDVTELAALRRIVPICAYCRKVRDDKEYWQNVELYCGRQLDVDFSHGICPDCFKRIHPEFADHAAPQ